MTRINVIPVEELHPKHLIAETREIVRMGSYIQKSLMKYKGDYTEVEKEIPENYKMGNGHVKFFYNKIVYLQNRYADLLTECKRRGFKVNEYDWMWRLRDCPGHWFKDWKPDISAIEINKERIGMRIPK